MPTVKRSILDRMCLEDRVVFSQFSTLRKIGRWFKANIACHTYLLFCGMWRGERQLEAWAATETLPGFIAACTGSLTRNNVTITKVFLHEPNVTLIPGITRTRPA